MDELERAQRLEAITEMFLGYGVAAPKERLKFYGNVTARVPLDIFRDAVRLACEQESGRWPPGPGGIVAAAKKLRPGRYSPGQGYSEPRWLSRPASRPLLEGGRDGD